MYRFIVNPNAKTGLGFQVWEEIEKVLKERQIEYRIYFTGRTRHATRIAREITALPGEHTIIALGGDGTINEVVNGISDLSRTTLGYIPIGSSNDFARGMNLTTDPLKALDHILDPKDYTHINIGVFHYEDKTKRFAVSGGFGFDAAVCHHIQVSKLKLFLNRIKLGKLSYAAVAVQRILSMTPQKMTVTLDDDRKMEFDNAYFAAAMNQKYEGGGFKFCPKADPGDDFMDVIVVAGLSKFKLLCCLPTAFKGWHTLFKGIYIYRCKKMELESDISLPIHADGEPVFPRKHVCASLEPEKLRVILS